MTTCRLLALGLALCLSTELAAQTPVTGTRLPKNEVAQPHYALKLKPSGEIAEIRRLVSEGKAEDAREVALAYVTKVEWPGHDAPTRYAAYNALCVAYTYTGETDKAEQECSRAIDLLPSRWQAYNSRGTVRMIAGDYEGAKDDYYSARKAVGDQNEDAAAVILHNLQVLKQRAKAESDRVDLFEDS